MPWLSSLSRWFFGTWTTVPVSRSFDPATFIALCKDDPDAARAMLTADQTNLAQEIEQTCKVYDVRLKDLESRVHALIPATFYHEAKKIRDAQDALRRALRRVEASTKSAKILRHELADWSQRVDTAPLHADHPRFRSEVIASELRSRELDMSSCASTDFSSSRDVLARDISKESKTNDRADVSDKNTLLWLTHSEADFCETATPSVLPSEEEYHEPLPMPETKYLLRAIYEATREAERWHAIPIEAHTEDAIIQVHHLRDLHAELKRIDRIQGIERDRIELAVCPRAVHY